VLKPSKKNAKKGQQNFLQKPPKRAQIFHCAHLTALIIFFKRSEMANLMDSDRRKYVRVTLNLLIKYETMEEFNSDYSQNLSLGGMFIKTDRPLPVGTELQIHFLLPDIIGAVTTEGVVMHNTLDDEDAEAEGMGIEFRKLSEQARKIIEQTLASNEEEQD
jgi:type IV pilus assembly protein PilZ